MGCHRRQNSPISSSSMAMNSLLTSSSECTTILGWIVVLRLSLGLYNPMPWEKISSRKMKTDENSWHMDVHFPPYWHMDPYVDPSYVFFKLYGEEKSAFQVLGLVWWFEAPLRWPITRGRTRCDAHTNDWWHPQTPHQRRSWRSCFTTEQRPADLQDP